MKAKAARRADRGPARGPPGNSPGELERGRELYRQRAWVEAREALSRADQSSPLEADDLFLLAMSAGLLGRTEELLSALERAHRAYLKSGNLQRAARMAFWLVSRLMSLGEPGRANGWLGRAKRLLERDGHDCVERGYLLLLSARRLLAGEDAIAAGDAAAEAAGIGERFGDADLSAFARNLQGQALLRQGRVKEGLALLDEAMVAVTAGEVSPVLTGVIYCNVIQGCQQVYALSRCREWTEGLAAWCEQEPEITFTGLCLVHRSEILQFNGSWPDAIDEARRAAARLSEKTDPGGAAEAFYQQAEVHRLRGDFAEAEQAYRRASQSGREPQPGLALLRLAQGRIDAATAQIRRVVGAAGGRLRRTQLLPACVEILLAAGDVEEADQACRDLEQMAKSLDTEVLDAMAAHARGAVALARGDARGALDSLCRSLDTWRRVGSPYPAARSRVLVGLACRALGDEDGAALEIDAARAAFRSLGAAPDLARIDALASRVPPERPHGLTARELQVLRLVAAGKTNKVIAAELFVSEKTIDRHLSNIFGKIDVPSRAAATAFAYQHKLVQGR
jgi:ATP/maltotriose-dependent transcriptional regulator MalT